MVKAQIRGTEPDKYSNRRSQQFPCIAFYNDYIIEDMIYMETGYDVVRREIGYSLHLEREKALMYVLQDDSSYKRPHVAKRVFVSRDTKDRILKSKNNALALFR